MYVTRTEPAINNQSDISGRHQGLHSCSVIRHPSPHQKLHKIHKQKSSEGTGTETCRNHSSHCIAVSDCRLQFLLPKQLYHTQYDCSEDVDLPPQCSRFGFGCPWHIRRFPEGGVYGIVRVAPAHTNRATPAVRRASCLHKHHPAISNQSLLMAKVRSQRGLWQSKRHHHTSKGKQNKAGWHLQGFV